MPLKKDGKWLTPRTHHLTIFLLNWIKYQRDCWDWRFQYQRNTFPAIKDASLSPCRYFSKQKVATIILNLDTIEPLQIAEAVLALKNKGFLFYHQVRFSSPVKKIWKPLPVLCLMAAFSIESFCNADSWISSSCKRPSGPRAINNKTGERTDFNIQHLSPTQPICLTTFREIEVWHTGDLQNSRKTRPRLAKSSVIRAVGFNTYRTKGSYTTQRGIWHGRTVAQQPIPHSPVPPTADWCASFSRLYV